MNTKHTHGVPGVQPAVFKDSFNRQIDYLRISITDRCSLKCIYCVPEQGVKNYDLNDILTLEEITRFVRVAHNSGVRKVRLTGGEPLMRDDIIDLVSAVKATGIFDLSMTTNGMRLAEMAGDLKKAGLDRVNISLDTLKEDRFRTITRGGDIRRVWDALKAAELAGFAPVKINVVPIRGVNDDEIPAFAALSLTKDIHIRFIEFMPVGKNPAWKPEAYLKTEEIMAKVAAVGRLERLEFRGNGPSRNYRIEGARGVVGFISAISDHFCESCNRLRLTANGKIRPCLFSDIELDVKTALRNGMSDEELDAFYREAVLSKPARHAIDAGPANLPATPAMSQIGG
jgi:cyclic pyranopterin phosphate synthase